MHAREPVGQPPPEVSCIALFCLAVTGVTSMSVDTHKFGMAHKGTSVVLYRSPDVRRHQFTQVRF
jgi:glutamate/tyrosine decarboxylase-like PLP-dependent enzyme